MITVEDIPTLREYQRLLLNNGETKKAEKYIELAVEYFNIELNIIKLQKNENNK